MKIVVFGATGGTGTAFVQQALNDGHEVTAIVRDPASFRMRHTRLHTKSGDALRPDSFAKAFQGQNAIVSTLGISSFLQSLRPMPFHRQSIQNIITHMRAVQLTRLLCVTITGVTKNSTAPWFYNLVIQPMLENKYEDMRQMEAEVRSSGLAWTVLRPFRLTNGRRTGQYRVGSDGSLDNAGTISRADVADLLLKSLNTGTHLHETVAVAY